MPFTYNPPTRTQCIVCDELCKDLGKPLIGTHNGKSTSANNFPFHNWYNFVLGYSPQFPEYMLQREKITKKDLVVDPFAGSGTTLVVCKKLGISSQGVDANDFMVDAARTKLNWHVNIQELKDCSNRVLRSIEEEYSKYAWNKQECEVHQPSLFDLYYNNKKDYVLYTQEKRPEMLSSKYISDIPFAKACLLHQWATCAT